MKTKLIIATTAVFIVAIFLQQKAQIQKLENDQEELQDKLTAKNSIRKTHDSNPSVPPRSSFSRQKEEKKQLEKVSQKLTELGEILAHPEPHKVYKEQQEVGAELLSLFSGLTHQDILSVLPIGPYDFEEYEDDDENIDPRMGKVVFSILLLTEKTQKKLSSSLARSKSKLKATTILPR